MAPAGSSNTPEAKARVNIDRQLEQAGWLLQHRDDMNLAAGNAIAVRELKLRKGHGFVDYLLFLDGRAVGVCEAKPAGTTLRGVEYQAKKYVEGLPAALDAPHKPLPFAYISTGEETVFFNDFDPRPRSREIFSFHRPETLREWLTADTLDAWLKRTGSIYTAADDTKPSTLRARLRAMPPVDLPGMWPNKITAVAHIEKSLFDDRPRSLIQMATGTGKTLLAVTTLYRLIKFGGARRVLFLVDRGNLAKQAEKEFQGFRTPDDHRKLTELYNIQRLTSNTIDSASKVVITTIQRLYSILKDEPDLDPEAEDAPFADADSLRKEPLPVVYSAAIPPEFFDIVFIDECHRSIYSLWRQVIEYFDAHLLGLTATPATHTYGFFKGNVVMEYPHEHAVADGVNCDYDVYRIRTRITAAGSTIEAAPGTMVGYRDRSTRKLRWAAPDEDVTYDAGDLDKNVVALDQIRLIVRTFRDQVLKETFRDRKEVPKTLIFAKDDSHAEDIVKIVREEFGDENKFAQKITYKVTGTTPDQLIHDFRTGYWPRVAVTVDLIATGTDIKPVEIVMFMRSVKSRTTAETITAAGLRHSSTKVNPAGSVLLGMIGEGKTRGQPAILDIDACGNQNAAAIWVSHTEVPPEYVYHYMVGQYEQTRRRGSGNNQPALNKTRVEAIPIPLAPLAEQRRIVDKLEADMSVISEAEASVFRDLKRVSRLRQSILKWAFEGKLVDQDPNDEPAEKLLSRIRAERATVARPGRKRVTT